MLNRICLCLAVIGVLFGFGDLANGKTLFRDDFEGDTLGTVPKNFEKYDHAHNNGALEVEVAKDPEGESGNVVHQFSYGYYIPKATGRDDWTDWIWEWDWMWSENGFPGTAFRITGGEYYHISPRDDNLNVGFWYWNGAWNQKGALVRYDFGLNTWNRFQVIANGDQFTLKIKRRDDPTPFSKIKPLLEAKDNTLKKGPMSVGGTNTDSWVDHFIVGETEADLTFPVEPAGKLATTWGALKNQD
jgi:hypothetical protein